MSTRGHAPLVGRPFFVRNAGGTRAPLYYLHGDFDGGGLYCLALGQHLGPDQPLCVLAPHGMDGAPLPPSLEAMAEAHLGTLRGLAPHGPYRLGGHCNGALVAYEMARRLAAAGETVERLVLIAARADTGRLGKSGEPEGRLAGYARRWRRLWLKSPVERRAAVLATLTEWFLPRRAPALAPRAPSPQRSPLSLAYLRLMVAHAPGPYAGTGLVLWPVEEPSLPGDDATLGWARVAPGLRVVPVPGGHHSSLTVHVAALAETLRRYLD